MTISSLFFPNIFKYRKRDNYKVIVYTGIDRKWDQAVHSSSTFRFRTFKLFESQLNFQRISKHVANTLKSKFTYFSWTCQRQLWYITVTTIFLHFLLSINILFAFTTPNISKSFFIVSDLSPSESFRIQLPSSCFFHKNHS